MAPRMGSKSVREADNRSLLNSFNHILVARSFSLCYRVALIRQRCLATWPCLQKILSSVPASRPAS